MCKPLLERDRNVRVTAREVNASGFLAAARAPGESRPLALRRPGFRWPIAHGRTPARGHGAGRRNKGGGGRGGLDPCPARRPRAALLLFVSPTPPSLLRRPQCPPPPPLLFGAAVGSSRRDADASRAGRAAAQRREGKSCRAARFPGAGVPRGVARSLSTWPGREKAPRAGWRAARSCVCPVVWAWRAGRAERLRGTRGKTPSLLRH